MGRRELLEHALRAHGITDPATLESHIRGCDLNLPVSEQVLPVGTTFQVWVRDGGEPGKYGAPIGEAAERLGIMTQNRHMQRYQVRIPLPVVRSTAATFPVGLVERVGGWGGGLQFLLPPAWLSLVERIL